MRGEHTSMGNTTHCMRSTVAVLVLMAAVPCRAATNEPPADASSKLSITTIALLQQGIRHLHNLNLREADQAFDAVIATASNHPAGYVYRAMTAWSRIMIDGTSDERQRAVAQWTDAAIVQYQNGTNKDAWSELFLGAAFVLRAGVCENAAEHIEAVQWAKRGLGRLSRAAQNQDTAADAAVLIGAYQYFTDGTPWYARFFASLFIMPADRGQGLENMHAGMRRATFFAPDARMLLAVAYSWDDETDRALELTDTLAIEYPGNHQIDAIRQSVLFRAGSIMEAYVCASNCLVRMENDPRLYTRGLLADQYYAFGVITMGTTNYDEAITHFATAYQLADRKPWLKAWAILRQGTAHDLLGQREAACQCYRAARSLQAGTQVVATYADLFLKEPYRGEPLE